MARRPALTDASFFNAVFHPKKALRPTGIRKSSASVNSKRKASRVKAFNAMDPLKQQVIIKAGNKESYLRGVSTLNESKQQLRPQAISWGVVKPLTPTMVIVAAIVGAAEGRNAVGNDNKLKAPISVTRVVSNVRKMTGAQRRRAATISSYQELIDQIDNWPDDEENLLWYK